jgi:hypothetical protein
MNKPTTEMLVKMITYLKASRLEPPIFYTSSRCDISSKEKGRFYAEVTFAHPGHYPVLTNRLHVSFTPMSCTYDSIVPLIRTSDITIPTEFSAWVPRLLCSSSIIFDIELDCLYLAGFVCVLFPEGNTTTQSHHKEMVVHGIPEHGACLVEVNAQAVTIDNLQWDGKGWHDKGWFSRPTPRPVQQTRPELCQVIRPSWTRTGLLRMQGTFLVDDLFLAVMGIRKASFDRVVDIVRINGGDPKKEMGLRTSPKGWQVDMTIFSKFLTKTFTLPPEW